MLMVIPDEGKLIWLSRAIELSAHFDFFQYIVRLYKNDYTPVDASVLDSFDAADFTGAAPWNIYAGDWDSVNVVGHVAEITTLVPPFFTCTGGADQTVYGWFMCDADQNFCLAAQRFNTPRLMTVGAIESLAPFTIRLKTFT